MVVCIKCRYPEDHRCTFNYQTAAKEKLTKENPVVIGKKIDKL